MINNVHPLLRPMIDSICAPTRIKLEGVTLGQLMTALRYSGLVVSNRDGDLVIHQADQEGRDGTAQR